MNSKRQKRSHKSEAHEEEGKEVTPKPVDTATPAPTAPAPVTTFSGPPPPWALEEWADQEPDRRELREYVKVIRKLRKKGFSFREIAEWLNDKGVAADHNAVYRVFTRNIDPHEAEAEEQRVREEAEENR